MVNEIVDYFVERSGIANISISVNIVINIFYFIEIKSSFISMKQQVDIGMYVCCAGLCLNPVDKSWLLKVTILILPRKLQP